MIEKIFRAEDLPGNLEEMSKMPEFALHSPYDTAALLILSMRVYAENPAASREMIDALRGPSPMSGLERQFLRDRMAGQEAYLAMSYFKGAVPGNGYTPSMPYTVEISDDANSFSQPSQARLFVHSGGASSARPLTLRHKPSTNQWFLWEYSSLLSGVQKPVSDDPWA